MSVLLLTEAKEHLNIKGSAHDIELGDVIAAAEAAITARVGPLEPVSKTARIRGNGCLVLPTAPAVSLTSVTPVGGTALLLGDLYLDPESAVVTVTLGGAIPHGWYDVTYMAGREDCPADLMLALKELVRHLWGPQRGGAQRPGSQPSDAMSNTLPGAAYAFPFRVEQLIAPYESPGVS